MLQLISKFCSCYSVFNKNEILLNSTDSLPQHQAVASSMPLPSRLYRHTYKKRKIFHPEKSTNSLATLLRPACLEWQGQRVGDDNMAALISSTQSFGLERHDAEAVSPGRSDPCLKGCSVVQSEGCWSLAVLPAKVTLLLSSWQTTEEEEGVTRQLIICICTWSLSVWGWQNHGE